MKPSRVVVLIGLLTILIALALKIFIYNGGNICLWNPVGYFKTRSSVAPDGFKADNDMAKAYESSGKHDEAASVYSRMLEKDPDHPDIYVNLAAIQIIKRNPEEAIKLCEKTIALDPKNPTAHNNLAVAYYMLGNFERAIYHCDLAIEYGYTVKPELIRLLKPYRE